MFNLYQTGNRADWVSVYRDQVVNLKGVSVFKSQFEPRVYVSMDGFPHVISPDSKPCDDFNNIYEFLCVDKKKNGTSTYVYVIKNRAKIKIEDKKAASLFQSCCVIL